MAQVSDTKDIGGDTWKEAGVGEFARTFGGNWGGNWGEVGWKLKGKWEGIGEKVRRNLRGSNGVSKGKTPNTVCLKVFRKRQHKTSAGRKRRREDSSLPGDSFSGLFLGVLVSW